MKVPVLINVGASALAWLVLVLAMAVFVGYQGACAVLASHELREAFELQAAAADAEQEAMADRARSAAILARAQMLLRKVEAGACGPRGGEYYGTREALDAAEMPRL